MKVHRIAWVIQKILKPYNWRECIPYQCPTVYDGLKCYDNLIVSISDDNISKNSTHTQKHTSWRNLYTSIKTVKKIHRSFSTKNVTPALLILFRDTITGMGTKVRQNFINFCWRVWEWGTHAPNEEAASLWRNQKQVSGLWCRDRFWHICLYALHNYILNSICYHYLYILSLLCSFLQGRSYCKHTNNRRGCKMITSSIMKKL